jgi:Ca2+-binding EF-hand superfamily protein
MADDITLAQLRPMAERAGLKLSDEELQRLLPGVSRSRNQVLELREFVTDTLEPAGTFAAPRTKEWR